MTLPDEVAARLDRYLDRHPDASAAQVLGRFRLDPDEYGEAVAERLGEDDDSGDRPLDQYDRRGYVRPMGDRDVTDDEVRARDAAVGLTASSWGPPIDTPATESGVWWRGAYHLVARGVEDAVVAALLADQDDEADDQREDTAADHTQPTLGEVAQ